MQLEILTPEKNVYSGKVNLVQVPGTKGSFAILKNHAPLISTLDKGRVRIINSSDSEELFDIEGGIIEVNNNKIIILAS